MGDCAIHNPFPSHARLPRAPAAASDRRGAQLAELVVAMARAAARPPPAHASRRPAGPAAPRPMASGAHLRYPDAVGNGNSVPMPDASAATLTSAELPLHCARPPRPTARTGGEFRHSLVGSEIAVGFETRQAALAWPSRRPLFWRHLGTRFRSYHRQKGLAPHCQAHMAIPPRPRAHFVV